MQTKEIEIIRKVAREIYGEGVRGYLFGSRLDDTKWDGDIDLLVRTTTTKRGVLERIRMIPD